jgi:Zn-dependent protease
VSFHHLVEAAGGSSFVTAAGDLLTVLLVLNVLLFVFNMLPVPPLDGASALAGVLPARAAGLVRAMNGNPAVSMLGLLVAWQLFPQFARPLFAALLRLVHPGDFYF